MALRQDIGCSITARAPAMDLNYWGILQWCSSLPHGFLCRLVSSQGSFSSPHQISSSTRRELLKGFCCPLGTSDQFLVHKGKPDSIGLCYYTSIIWKVFIIVNLFNVMEFINKESLASLYYCVMFASFESFRRMIQCACALFHQAARVPNVNKGDLFSIIGTSYGIHMRK